MKEFQVTVDFRGTRARGESTTGIDIALLVGVVPSAVVLAGDPGVSLQVRVAESEQAQLRSALKGICVIEDYADLDLH